MNAPAAANTAPLRAIEMLDDIRIPMPDGVDLAARIWRPVDAAADPVPAILEFVPYRRRDGTAERDALTHPWFAARGYACVRVDIRGSGDSAGVLEGEYLPREQEDALAILAWLEAQPWCTGKVGMIGISWGGFNGLQVAARRPKQLKARGVDRLHRRPVRGRHPLHGRLPAARQGDLVLDHVLA